MRVNLILPCYAWKPSGGFKVVYEYANRLSKAGFTVNVIHPIFNKKNPFEYSLNKSFFLTIKQYIKHKLFKPNIYWHEVDHNVRIIVTTSLDEKNIPNAEFIIATAWITAEFVVKYASDKGIKYYLVQDFYPYLGRKEDIEKTWQYPMKKIAISKWISSLIMDSGANKNDVIYIPNGIEHNVFYKTNPDELRQVDIIFQYSEINYKNCEIGIQAIEKLKNDFPNLQVVAYGFDCSKRVFPSYFKLFNKINSEDLAKIFNQSKIFLSTSLCEGFALPPAEAMACGCMVITTDNGGNRDYAINGYSAIVTDNSVDDIYNNLKKTLNDNALRKGIAEKGNHLIKSFTWENAAKSLINLLNNSH
jgi:glycosyltransferase involved in cell wall biosynthesis